MFEASRGYMVSSEVTEDTMLYKKIHKTKTKGKRKRQEEQNKIAELDIYWYRTYQGIFGNLLRIERGTSLRCRMKR